MAPRSVVLHAVHLRQVVIVLDPRPTHELEESVGRVCRGPILTNDRSNEKARRVDDGGTELQQAQASGRARGPGRPRASDPAITRRRLLRSAREVFSEMGYAAATRADIAIRANVTAPMINHYFESKAALYREAVAYTNRTVVNASAQSLLHADTLSDQLDLIVEGAVIWFRRDRSAAQFLITSILEPRRHPELRQDGQDSVKAIRELLTSTMTDAIERGEIELAPESSSETFVEFFIAMMCGLGVYAGFIGGRPHIEAVAPLFRQMMSQELWQRLSHNEFSPLQPGDDS